MDDLITDKPASKKPMPPSRNAGRRAGDVRNRPRVRKTVIGGAAVFAAFFGGLGGWAAIEDNVQTNDIQTMLDLGRNDVGRVAQIGSVKVSDSMVIERYSHVMHIASNVEGRLKPGLDAMDVLKASFPAGTVSGAPKVRAMEIIDELETGKRGIYAGAVGYLGFSGDMDLAIAIRTAVVKDGTLYVQAGAGIVADSVPENEWIETQNKALALLRAAEMAQAGLNSRLS